MAVNYLWVHHRHSSERVAELLEPYAERGGNWAPRLRPLMERAKCHKSRRFFDLFLRLLANGALDDARDRGASNGTFWSMLYSLGQERPEWVPEVVAHRLRRRFTEMGVGENDAGWAGDDHDSFAAELIARSAKKAPRAFVRHVLPVVLEISDSAVAGHAAAPRRDRVWPLRIKSKPFGLKTACLSGLVDSLATLGSEAECDLRDVIDELRRRDTYTGNHLLLALYGGSAETLADEAVTTLCEEPWRFECGFTDRTYWSARETIRAVVPHCGPSNRERLESVILDYVAPYERSPGGYKELGRAQFALLSAIPAELRSESTNKRSRELVRKFGEPEEAPRGIAFRSHSIANCRRRDGANDGRAVAWRHREVPVGRPACFGRERIEGGARQLAERLGERTVEDPERFARLALRLPGDANPVYLDADACGAQGSGDREGAETRGLSQSVEGVTRAVWPFDCRRTRRHRRGATGTTQCRCSMNSRQGMKILQESCGRRRPVMVDGGTMVTRILPASTPRAAELRTSSRLSSSRTLPTSGGFRRPLLGWSKTGAHPYARVSRVRCVRSRATIVGSACRSSSAWT